MSAEPVYVPLRSVLNGRPLDVQHPGFRAKSRERDLNKEKYQMNKKTGGVNKILIRLLLMSICVLLSGCRWLEKPGYEPDAISNVEENVADRVSGGMSDSLADSTTATSGAGGSMADTASGGTGSTADTASDSTGSTADTAESFSFPDYT